MINSPRKKRKEETRQRCLSVWFTPAEYEQIKAKIVESNLSTSDYLRAVILSGFVVKRESQEQLRMTLDDRQLLREYRTNFSRIGNLIKGGQMKLAGDDVLEIMAKIDTFLKRYL